MVISNKLKSVLHKVIHDDEKGSIAGRFIRENIRQIHDVIFETQLQNIPGYYYQYTLKKPSILFHGSLYVKNLTIFILETRLSNG